ncbi:MAG: hypothetical protein HC896_00135 [Bacteroidales bacterium]|nr:hypothetical protein [Bacteroidales bacterium]
MDKDFLSDFHQVNMHLLRDEFDEASEIIKEYVLIASTHPNKVKMPIKQLAKVALMVGSIPIPEPTSFQQLIKKLVDLANQGRVSDPTFRFN